MSPEVTDRRQQGRFQASTTKRAGSMMLLADAYLTVVWEDQVTTLCWHCPGIMSPRSCRVIRNFLQALSGASLGRMRSRGTTIWRPPQPHRDLSRLGNLINRSSLSMRCNDLIVTAEHIYIERVETRCRFLARYTVFWFGSYFV
jgi:hypothetical protein